MGRGSHSSLQGLEVSDVELGTLGHWLQSGLVAEGAPLAHLHRWETETQQNHAAKLAGRSQVWTLWSLCMGTGTCTRKHKFTAGGEESSRGVGR